MIRRSAFTPAVLLDRWQKYWFLEIPPSVYALLRIALGIVGLLGLLELTPIGAFWSEGGILPEPGGGFGVRQELSALGLASLFGEVLFVALLLAFTCMVIGYRTSAAIAASWGLSVVQAKWNPLPLAGSHRVLICLLFPLIWAECGSLLSVDASRRPGGTPPVGAAIWPLRLIRFQVALIYLNSGLSKLLLEPWRDGSAVYYAVSSNLFHRFPMAIPPSLEWLTSIATFLTLGWEIAFAGMLLHPRSRRAALIFGVLLHFGMGVVMELGTFSLVMLASYVAFLEPPWAERLLSVIGRRVSRRHGRNYVRL